MGCLERKAKLMDWVLDELGPAEVRELEQHIQQCAECSRSAERMRTVHGALKTSLVDRELPGHLVFVADRPRSRFEGLWTSLWRTAALSATAAVVFLGILAGGATYWRNRLAPGRLATAGPAVESALTPADVKALAAQEVGRQIALERHEIEAANANLAANLREEQMRSLDRMARQLDLVQSVQSSVWKETQQQGAMVELIARNSFESKVPAPGKR